MPRRLDPACVANGPGECRERLVVSERAQEGPLLAALIVSTKLDGANFVCAWGAGLLGGPVCVGVDCNNTYVWMFVLWGLWP